MKTIQKFVCLWVFVALVMTFIPASMALAATGDTVADSVLGQYDFSHRAPNLVDARGLANTESVAIDKSVTPNRIFVADWVNSRVLGWKNVSAYANGDPADLVIGQPDFLSNGCNGGASGLCEPSGVAVDTHGNLYVADTGHQRVLEFDTPFASCGGSFPCVGGAAHLVFGQSSFTTYACNNGATVPGQSSLCYPWGVTVDASGNLYVADFGNNRVLEYNTPLTTDTAADQVFGQSDFTTNACNNGGTVPSQSSLCNPSGVAVDASDDLYVADTNNQRVLEYNTPLAPGGDTVADRVFGQDGDFTTNTCDNGGTVPSQSSLCSPEGVAVDASGDLYVADVINSRVLEYDTPLAVGGDTVADTVFGQGGDFTTNTCNKGGISQNSLCGPVAAAVDASGDLYVADTNNSRVLEYVPPLASDLSAVKVLGQLDFSHGRANLVDARGLYGPQSVTIDKSVTPNRVFVADAGNSRVLGWRDASAYANGAPADLVIGQPDFLSYGCSGGASGLCEPSEVAVDGTGNLYVADLYNNRVLEFDAPFASCGGTFPCVGGAAHLVFGQGNSFTSYACNKGGISQNSLCGPRGVAVDASDNLYVADTNNSRVLEYDTPLAPGSDTVADTVFGQSDFSTRACNNGGVSARSLCGPTGATVDASGDLYVADFANSRVLEYDTPLAPGSDTVADTVFGQGGDFTTNAFNKGGISQSSLADPIGVAVGASGNLYVADFANSRVLEYDTPLLTDTVADTVFGQAGDFTTNAFNKGGISANSLGDPIAVAADAAGDLFVADTNNSRVLEYDQPLGVSSPIIGTGSTVNKDVTLGNNANIGSNVTLNKGITAGDNLVVGDGTSINQSVTIGDNVVIGANVTIAQGVVIGNGVHIGDGSIINKDCQIHDNATLGMLVTLGQQVIVSAGVSISDNTVVPAKTTVAANLP